MQAVIFSGVQASGKTTFYADVQAALEAGFEVVGCEFRSPTRHALERNDRRAGRARISVAGLLGTYKRLEALAFEEGYREVLIVEIDEKRGFVVTARPGGAPE